MPIRFLTFAGLMVAALVGLTMLAQRRAPPPSPAAEPAPLDAPAEIVSETEPGKIAAQPVAPDTAPPTARDLSRPMPASRQELINKLTSYEPPILPGGGERHDLEVNTVYRGFYEATPGKFRRIQLARGKSFVIELETVDGRFKKWTDETKDLIVENFNGDRYSLAITLPDQRVLYTKYFAEQELPEYNAHNWRVLKGWLVSAGGGAAQRVALIDGTMPELEDLKEKNKFIWPQLGVIQKIMPGALP